MRVYALKWFEYDFIVCLAMFICYGRSLVIFRDLLWFLAELWPGWLKCYCYWFFGGFQCFRPRIEAIVIYLCCSSWDARLHVLCARFGVVLIVFWGFNENDLNIGFSVFSWIACLGMPYWVYGCILYFIPEIPVYGTLVLEFDSSVVGFKSVF